MDNTQCNLDQEHPIISGDGSVRLYEQLVSAAWAIEGDYADKADKGHISACVLLQNISSISCYYTELEEFFRSLYHMEQMGITINIKEVEQWCSNKQQF